MVTVLPLRLAAPSGAGHPAQFPPWLVLWRWLWVAGGNMFISVGLLICGARGAFLAWTLFAAEVPFMAAKNNLMPNFLNRENAQKVPARSLWMTNLVVQAFLIVTLFAENAFDLALELTSAMALIPYLTVAASP